MAKYADKVMVSCVAITLVIDHLESGVPYENNPTLEAIRVTVRIRAIMGNSGHNHARKTNCP